MQEDSCSETFIMYLKNQKITRKLNSNHFLACVLLVLTWFICSNIQSEAIGIWWIIRTDENGEASTKTDLLCCLWGEPYHHWANWLRTVLWIEGWWQIWSIEHLGGGPKGDLSAVQRSSWFWPCTFATGCQGTCAIWDMSPWKLNKWARAFVHSLYLTEQVWAYV